MSRHPVVDVRGLKVHFPIYGGVISKKVGTVRRWMVFRSVSANVKLLVLSVNQAVVKRPWGAP